MSIDLRFTDDDWSRIRRDWSAWWDGDLDRPMVMIETSHQMVLPGEQVLTREFLLEKPAEQVVDYFSNMLEQKRFHGDAFPRWFPNVTASR